MPLGDLGSPVDEDKHTGLVLQTWRLFKLKEEHIGSFVVDGRHNLGSDKLSVQSSESFGTEGESWEQQEAPVDWEGDNISETVKGNADVEWHVKVVGVPEDIKVVSSGFLVDGGDQNQGLGDDDDDTSEARNGSESPSDVSRVSIELTLLEDSGDSVDIQTIKHPDIPQVSHTVTV